MPGLRLVALVLALFAAAPAAAQQVLRIAAVVNEDIISVLDLGERVRLVILTSGLKDDAQTSRRLAPEVLRVLIDERLQLQEAARLNITVSEDEIARAFAAIERQARMQPGGMDEFLQQGRLRRTVVVEQLRAEIAWRKVIQRRLRAAAVIADDEIEEALNRVRQSQGKPQHLVSEILLPVDRPDQEAAVQERATQLVAELRAGANFAAVARQFSAGVTAAQGGDMGWLLPGQADEDLERALLRMQPGQISAPVRNLSGFRILQLRERRVVGAKEGTGVVALRQVALALPQNATDEQRSARATELERALDGVQGCEAFAKVAEKFGMANQADLGKVKEGELPPDIRRVVDTLSVGTPSAPLPARAVVRALMVCERSQVEGGGLPSRQEIADGLMQGRVELQARRYLRDLRRAAIVDIRI